MISDRQLKRWLVDHRNGFIEDAVMVLWLYENRVPQEQIERVKEEMLQPRKSWARRLLCWLNGREKY